MLRPKSIVAIEAEVVQVIEGELGRKLPLVDEFDASSFGLFVVDRHVRGLAVPESGLRRLPDNIGLLSKLEVINLKGCHLERLPNSIGDLGCLRTLGLRSNCLASLPASLGKLHELRALSVSENQLGSLPDSIGNLVNLRELVLHKNNLTSLPATVGGLANLQLLVLTENNLESIPGGVGSMLKLKECYLAGNRLTKLPDSIGRLTGLRRLVLDDNPLDESSLQLARELASSGCVVSMTEENVNQARVAQLVANLEVFAESASGEALAKALKSVFMIMIPYFEEVEATYEEDFCLSAVKLSNVKATDAGIQAVVTFLSGYEEPGKQWDFSCPWDGLIYTASKWFILNIGTFTFHNSHMRFHDKISRAMDETNRLLGLDKTIARVEKHMDDHYWGMVGTEYMKAGRFEEAEKALNKSLELAPTSAPAWGRLAIFFNNRGRKAEALDAVENALRFAPPGWSGIEVMQEYRRQLKG